MRKKIIQINFRVTPAEWSRIKVLAKIYCEGNVSQWLLYAAMNAPRAMLKKEKRPA